MKTAPEAKAASIGNTEVQKQLEIMSALIDRACERGELGVRSTEPLLPGTCKVLASLGYGLYMKDPHIIWWSDWLPTGVPSG